MNGLRQTLLGVGMFVGSGVLLYAMVQKAEQPVEVSKAPLVSEPSGSESDTTIDPLTADIETETRLLQEKRLAREAQTAEQEARTQKFLQQQEQAEKLALQKTRLENQMYTDNVIEPVMDKPAPDTGLPNSEVYTTISKPVVTSRPIQKKDVTVSEDSMVSETRAKEYQVKSGDGLIMVANRHQVPVEALARANNLTLTSTLEVGQILTIPAGNQIPALLQAAKKQATSSKTTVKSKATAVQPTQTSDPAPSKPSNSSSAPSSPIDYQVKRGDGLIKLARQYNVPVAALAQANNLDTTSDLRVGQTLTIPSRRQVTRLEREAREAQQATANRQDAQARLREARQAAAQGEAKGTFGVQIALADNQVKADELVKKMKAAGYPASTSATSRGVRVIVGPEKGKEAALALKDKINADPKVNVSGAWVLYWR